MTIQSAMLCDRCDAVFVTEKGEHRRVLTIQAHEAGWTSIGKNGIWENYCDECGADPA